MGKIIGIIAASVGVLVLVASAAYMAIHGVNVNNDTRGTTMQHIVVSGGVQIKIDLPTPSTANAPVTIKNIGLFDYAQAPIVIPQGGTAILVGNFHNGSVDTYKLVTTPGTLSVKGLPLGTTVTLVYGTDANLVKQTVKNITNQLMEQTPPVLQDP